MNFDKIRRWYRTYIGGHPGQRPGDDPKLWPTVYDVVGEHDDYDVYDYVKYSCGQQALSRDEARAVANHLVDEFTIDEIVEGTDRAKTDTAQQRPYRCENVEKLCQKIFENISDQKIEEYLSLLYREKRKEFGLESIVSEVSTDRPEYSFHVPDPEPASVAPSGEAIPATSTSYEEKTVEMQNAVTKIELERDVIGESVREMVQYEADMLWDELDVVWTGSSVDDLDESILEARHEVMSRARTPDTVVLRGYTEEDVHGIFDLDVAEDETEVMDVPFVVADSDGVGYRVTRSEVSVDRLDKNPWKHEYTLSWSGNYVVVDEDAYSGPV